MIASKICGEELHALPDDAKLEKVRVFVSLLGNRDLLKFVHGVENFFTFGQGDRTFECMWSHFCMELKFGDSVGILERTEHGVFFSQRELEGDEVETWAGVPDHHVTFGQVKEFYEEQKTFNYEFHCKNCKHFTYDFFARIVHQRHVGDFGCFCQSHEKVFKYKTKS